jgi:Xaa-Pro dipeptidase
MAENLIRLPFDDDEYALRVGRVKENMGQHDLDALLVTVPENYFYLSGFQTGTHYSFIVLIVPRSGPAAWVLRKTELSNARSLASVSWVKDAYGVDDSENPIEILASVLRNMGYASGRIGVELETFFFHASYYLSLRTELASAEFVDASMIINSLRAVKSAAELRYMRQAGEITTKALRAGIDALHEGMLDRELAIILVSTAIREGSEPMSGGPFVTLGQRSYLAHSSWVGAQIRKGDIVNTEMAATVSRYNVPTFRVSTIGEPSDELRRFHDASKQGLEVGLAKIAPGMTSAEADRVVRSTIARAGYAEEFVVRAAYSIGLGFAPRWSENHVMSIRPDDSRALEVGMCFHLVPALYKKGLGAVCCSMPIEIIDGGCRPLSSMPAELFIR